ncbi:MAG: hypothetical protein WAT79_17585 [Saprospiraceae bacterium]
MKSRFNIWFSFLIISTTLVGGWKTSSPESRSQIMAIDVFAGEDQNLCPGASLPISTLNATISGEVTNGYWFTSGDGRFLPGYTTSARFSTATSYIPGVQDNSLGNFTLTLVSDDPDLDPITGTNGPKVQVSDQVRISFPPPPSLVCNTNLHVSLNFDCTILLDASTLIANPRIPYQDYIVEMYDKNQVRIPNELLTKDHIAQNITFKVGHICTSHYCWGNLQVSDYYPPIFECRNDTISCILSSHPDSLALPIPILAAVDSFKNNKYYIRNWDACSQVQLSYTDETEKMDCSIPVYDKMITRTWSAKDASQNLSTCTQKILLRKAILSDIVFPPSFDDVQNPSFNCLDSFPVFPNGHPSTDTTGIPSGGSCSNIGIVMTDIRFETCGAGFKLARSWFVIEWCSQESTTRNQIILVKDKNGPQFVCPVDLTLGTGFYTCATGQQNLPLPTNIKDCSDFQTLVQITDLQGHSLNTYLFYTNQQYFVNNLPIGEYIVKYTLVDVCQNTSLCEMHLTVVDIAPPIPVCDKTTKISLDHIGRARLNATSLDDGSWDNCGILKYEIKRKNDPCGHTLEWRTSADFCCEDIGTIQHVSMQVTDIHGLVNTCHVEVEVEDKLPPSITCPSHLTISCDHAYDPQNLDVFGKVALTSGDRKSIVIIDRINNGIVGQDGITTDNCSVTIEKRNLFDVTCFTGTIRRTFIATDKGQRKDSCTQIISLYNPDPFDYNDITWPSHYTGIGCKVSDVDTTVAGAPRFKNTSCGVIASTYEDQPFFIADSACVKIFRNWYVIDWCQFNETTLEGRWGPYTQIIKISNQVAPTIQSTCTDTLICNVEENCAPTLATLTAFATDDCTPLASLAWEYSIDLNQDGILDFSGTKNSVQQLLPNGHHSIKWTVRDQCGNMTFCNRNIEVKDCKKPTPYCISQVSMTLDEVNHMAEIWAIDLDLGSLDNCTPQHRLAFSFSTDTLHNVIFLGCEDIPNGRESVVPVNLYVTDLAGNQHFCSVTVFLTDNSDVCPNTNIIGNIEGKITTTTGYSPEDIQVQFRAIDKTEHSVAHANESGKYIIPQVSDEYQFILKPRLTSKVGVGLSTLDIVLIQRHIIGTKVFDNPYTYLAADVNQSRSLNSIDLVELRKVILGMRTTFPNQTPSWIFVDTKEDFPLGPFGKPYTDTLITKSPSFDNDFIAIKVGDINQSFEHDNLSGSLETRLVNDYFVFSPRQNNEETTIEVSNENTMSLDGFQIFLEVPISYLSKAPKIVSTLNQYGFYLDYAFLPKDEHHHWLKIIGYTDQPIVLEKNTSLFSIDLESYSELYQDEENWSLQSSEVYIGEKPFPLYIRWNKMKPVQEEMATFSLLANPVKGEIRLSYTSIPNNLISCKLMDLNGKIAHRFDTFLQAQSSGLLEIPLPFATRSGMYYLLVDNGENRFSFPVVVID